MIHELNEHLLQQLKKGHTVALLIDEGQNLSDDALEGLCSLSNLETEEEKVAADRSGRTTGTSDSID